VEGKIRKELIPAEGANDLNVLKGQGKCPVIFFGGTLQDGIDFSISSTWGGGFSSERRVVKREEKPVISGDSVVACCGWRLPVYSPMQEFCATGGGEAKGNCGLVGRVAGSSGGDGTVRAPSTHELRGIER